MEDAITKLSKNSRKRKVTNKYVSDTEVETPAAKKLKSRRGAAAIAKNVKQNMNDFYDKNVPVRIVSVNSFQI